jgi:hypothetical protein
MNKLAQIVFSLALTLIAVLAFAQHAKSQTSTGVGVNVTRGPHPAWEGKAAGDAQPFERNNADLKTALLSQPVPDVWLEFAESQREGQPSSRTSEGAEPIIKVTLPPDAKRILNLFWKEALKFDYNEAFAKPSNAQESFDRDMAWMSYHAKTELNLQQVEIAAPDGRRTISDVEAIDLAVFAHKASISLVEKAKAKQN